ncbi:hypothetical protein [Streptomyces sp. NBC_01217]|uniref:hypothetical protein n=1 Tax=Streptomyces sp. NBC_01217 TaxID=2903779 RepID=UPI002E0DD96B|nr:hypothetical protein OG507_05260 [Streptomyces sp. NBC_01217]
MSTADNRAAAAWLCAAVPDLLAGASEDEQVLAWIDQATQAVRDGEPAAAVCRRLGYSTRTDPDKHAGDMVGLDDFGLDPVQVEGDYRCPAGRCSRRAHPDERGREPRCAVDDAPMVLRARPRP